MQLPAEEFKEVWIKADRDGELVIPQKSRGNAEALKTTLYRVARRVREGKEVNPALLQAISRLSARVVETPEGWAVLVGPMLQSTLLESVRAVLGPREAPEVPEWLRNIAVKSDGNA